MDHVPARVDLEGRDAPASPKGEGQVRREVPVHHVDTRGPGLLARGQGYGVARFLRPVARRGFENIRVVHVPKDRGKTKGRLARELVRLRSYAEAWCKSRGFGLVHVHHG